MATTLPQKIIDLREKMDWSQTDLALKMGFSKSTMNKIESGVRKVTADELKSFAQLFHVSADYLLGLSGLPTDPSKHEQIDLSHLFHSNMEISYEEKTLSHAEKLFIDDVIGGYIWKSSQSKK
ncbi:helix-turn-helix transcriptional regulator [Enterococcus saccharolyticus]|uniref:HTH cro/C1-type domain-containing protein n=1 Tax=Candidatus Enterococcus willemsii TaxID=1857215 RepID=A0ABQ6Z298_9ENTE|nr:MULTISPECIES: helix-turn-helix transcriptional regulator [Enterococcus]KAF1305711.1 hypothetical protein BAU17_00230 [Enterococcus sp. CU12B]MCD5001471.1 helix-turn-helix transcriptional regulator [Enterococcus saccharolyticus]